MCFMWSWPLSLAQPRVRLLSPSPEMRILLRSPGRISLDFWLCGGGEEGITGCKPQLAFNISPCSFLQRSCSWHPGTVPFVTPNRLLARRLQTDFSFQSQRCLAENFQQQNHGISLAASVLLSKDQEHKEGQLDKQPAPCKRMERDPETCTFLPTPQN